MPSEYTLETLARNIREWCSVHSVRPANGQVADEVSERTIRYYRTLGLLDAQAGTHLRIFTEMHRLQLLAIRIYQAQGVPLRRIHEQLYGKSEGELLGFVQKAESQLGQVPRLFDRTASSEQWCVNPLTEDLLIISRSGRSLPPLVLHQLQAALANAGWPDGLRNPTH